MRQTLITRSLLGAALAVTMFLAATAVSEAAKGDQANNGRRVPEVPISALLPAASGLVGGGYYLLYRIRGRRRDDR